MKTVIGIALGLLGALLLNIDIGAISVALGAPLVGDDVQLTWLDAAWSLASCVLCPVILLRGAATTRQVVSRGAVMGLVLWGVLIPFASTVARKLAVAPGSGLSTDPVVASQVVDVLSWLALGMVIVMVLVSALVLAAARAQDRSAHHGDGGSLSPVNT